MQEGLPRRVPPSQLALATSHLGACRFADSLPVFHAALTALKGADDD